MDTKTLNTGTGLNNKIKRLSEKVAQLKYMLKNFTDTLVDVVELEITTVGYDGGGDTIEESVTLSSYSESPNFDKRKELVRSLLELELSQVTTALALTTEEFNSLK